MHSLLLSALLYESLSFDQEKIASCRGVSKEEAGVFMLFECVAEIFSPVHSSQTSTAPHVDIHQHTVLHCYC